MSITVFYSKHCFLPCKFPTQDFIMPQGCTCVLLQIQIGVILICLMEVYCRERVLFEMYCLRSSRCPLYLEHAYHRLIYLFWFFFEGLHWRLGYAVTASCFCFYARYLLIKLYKIWILKTTTQTVPVMTHVVLYSPILNFHGHYSAFILCRFLSVYWFWLMDSWYATGSWYD